MALIRYKAQDPKLYGANVLVRRKEVRPGLSNDKYAYISLTGICETADEEVQAVLSKRLEGKYAYFEEDGTLVVSEQAHVRDFTLDHVDNEVSIQERIEAEAMRLLEERLRSMGVRDVDPKKNRKKAVSPNVLKNLDKGREVRMANVERYRTDPAYHAEVQAERKRRDEERAQAIKDGTYLPYEMRDAATRELLEKLNARDDDAGER